MRTCLVTTFLKTLPSLARLLSSEINLGITAFPVAFCCRPPNWCAGKNGMQGLQIEGAVLDLCQDSARNDPGIAQCKKHHRRKNTSKEGPRDRTQNTETLYSCPAAVRHFCRFNGAIEYSCPAGQYCQWMGTMGWMVISGASLPGRQRDPWTSVGFGVLRVADVLARQGSGRARLTRG